MEVRWAARFQYGRWSAFSAICWRSLMKTKPLQIRQAFPGRHRPSSRHLPRMILIQLKTARRHENDAESSTTPTVHSPYFRSSVKLSRDTLFILTRTVVGKRPGERKTELSRNDRTLALHGRTHWRRRTLYRNTHACVHTRRGFVLFWFLVSSDDQSSASSAPPHSGTNWKKKRGTLSFAAKVIHTMSSKEFHNF